MKFHKNLTAAVSTVALCAAMLLSFGGIAKADCFQYDPNGLTTSQTPVFNNICNVPNGTGNESDFVKIRPNTTGDDTSTANNAAYVNSLTSACNDGDKFDIHTYVHNDASPDFNNNGSGSAVAHGVQMSLAAPLGSTNTNFPFTSTVTANNAATVRDSATLNCSNGPVKLTLVPHTVKVYGTQYSWTGLADNSVNGTFPIGSPTVNSGDVWGCWQYRIVVVYEVTVQKLTPPPATYTCDLLTLAADTNRKVTITSFKATSTNGAVFKDATIDWGDGSAPLTSTNPPGQTHQFAKDGTYTVRATANFTLNGQVVSATGPNCVQTITVKTNTTTPVYTCDMFDITADVDRVVKVSNFKTTAANGAVFKNVVVNWGDNSTDTTSSNIVGQTHQYDKNKDATYTITATAHFTVNGQDVTATSAQCSKQVTFKGETPPIVTPPPVTPPTTPPTTPGTPGRLVNTGPGSVATLFAVVAAAGTLAHRRFLSRRLGNQ